MPELTHEAIERLTGLHEKATPGPHQVRFIYRMIQSVRVHATTLGLMLQPNANRDWADAELWTESVNNLPGLLELAGECLERRETQKTMIAAQFGESDPAAANSAAPSVQDDLLAALQGLLILNEKQFRMLEETARRGLSKMKPLGLKFDDLKFVKLSRAAIARAGSGGGKS